jgi:hypothetical protein
VLRPAEVAVARAHLDIVIAQPLQALARLFGELRDDFQRIDLLDQAGQNGRLVSGTGTYFKDHVFRLGADQFGHQGDDIGLRNGLPMPDRQRVVGISAVHQFFRNKSVPRYRAQDLEYPLLQCRATGQMAGREHFVADFIEQQIDLPMIRLAH